MQGCDYGRFYRNSHRPKFRGVEAYVNVENKEYISVSFLD